MVGLAVGQPSVKEIADGQYYTDLPGGVLESMGRLFKRSVKKYVYPARDPVSGEIHTVERAQVPPPEQARKHLTEQELVNLTLVIVAINALESPEH